MDLGLREKRALVTGSTSGIGEAIAKALAAEGAQVVVHGRKAAEADRVVAAITTAGGRAAAVLGDLAMDAGADRVAEAAGTAFGGIDILVNNAGEFPFRSWSSATPADWGNLFNTNVVSMVRMIQRLLPGMKQQRWGRCIQVSSCMGTRPRPFLPDYAASKAAILNLTVSLSKELKGTGITANAVTPGAIVTPGFQEMFLGLADAKGWPKDWDFIEAQLVAGDLANPIGRLGRPQDVAHLVAYLSSPLSDFITGANLRVDGGYVETVG